MSIDRSFLAERRERLRARGNNDVNGIDRIDIGTADKSILQVHLVHTPDALPAFDKDDFQIQGGDRIRGLKVETVTLAGSVLTLGLNMAGDFSVYILRILRSEFDNVLRDIAFGFRAECPEVFDVCELPPDQAPAPSPAPATDYLAKDFESFKRQMLDRLSTLSPAWRDREISDIGMTLVELLAHYADHLSYSQDVAANEAYLNTARLRSSLRRHARLLGYDVFDGLSARVFAHLEVGGDQDLEPSVFSFMTRNNRVKSVSAKRVDIDIHKLLKDGTQFFEPVPITELDSNGERTPRLMSLRQNHNAMSLYDWGDPLAVLPRGATQAWIIGDAAQIQLKAGDFVCLEQLQREGAKPIEDLDNLSELDPADMSQRQIVRLIEDPAPIRDELPSLGPAVDLMKITWHAEDALKFDLQLGHIPDPNAPGDITKRTELARACGNIILCDNGVSLIAKNSDFDLGEALGAPLDRNDPELKAAIASLSDLDSSASFRPSLRETELSIISVPHNGENLASAHSFLNIDSREAMPAIVVKENGAVWNPTKSLIDASEDARLFVPELEEDGRTYLRFPGAQTFGAEPETNELLYAHYRVGRGPAGNIGAESLHHAIHDITFSITKVRNPLAGFGGAQAQSFEDIRIKAPRTITQNERAVTPDDYAQRVSLHPDVTAARVRKVWHGSWHTLFISVDPAGGLPFTEDLRGRLLDYLEPYRLMGQDIQIDPPIYAPLDIILHICVNPAHRQADVLRAVKAALSAARLENGELAFFHPDRLSFGDPIYLSQIYAAAGEVPGVADVKVIKFARWGTEDETALEDGIFKVGPSEIPILMNDPNYAERGVLRVQAWREN
ncbi:baseplate J/gp47 family protein [Hellea sp.]|nr:baseplate J/gp47 family protein [Hellea sp.]